MNDNSPTPTPPDKMVRLDATTFVSPAPPQIPEHELLRCDGHGAYDEVWLTGNFMVAWWTIRGAFWLSVGFDPLQENQRMFERDSPRPTNLIS